MFESERLGAHVGTRRHAEVQYAVSRVLSRARDTTDAFQDLLPSIAAALGWHYASVWLVDSEDTVLECTHAWAVDEPPVSAFAHASKGLRSMRGQGFPGRVWSSARPLWLSDAFRLPDFRRASAARDTGFVDGIAFAVQSSRGVVAVIECFTRIAETPDLGLLRLTEALGHQIGLFLDRRAAEERLEENEARYAAIVNGALDAIVVIDDHGRITEFNAAAERLFGYTRADVVGEEMAGAIVPPDFRVPHRDGLRRHIASGESRILERRLERIARRRDGTDFPVELTICRIPSHGRPAFIGFLRDITDRQRYEQEREALLEAERHARMEATAANGLKDEFLASLSHEMRTPLNAVLGWTRMLITNTVAPDRVPQVLKTVFRNAEAQKRMVDDLLDVSAFVTGQMRMELGELNIADVVHGASEAFRPAADAKRIRVTLRVQSAVVRGDRMRLQQVFWNLLSNAVKFTPPSGAIDIASVVGDEGTKITVSDDGTGIDAAFLPFVFDRFRQGAGVHANTGGLGIGLALVRQIVEAHGGSVFAASPGAGQGTSFTVVLPLAIPDARAGATTGLPS